MSVNASLLLLSSFNTVSHSFTCSEIQILSVYLFIVEAVHNLSLLLYVDVAAETTASS